MDTPGWDRRVADAADAWLTDPADTQVYTRLVAAVLARRAHLHPTLDLGGTGAAPAGGRPGAPGPDEHGDTAAEAVPAPTSLAVARLGDLVSGDPREALMALGVNVPPAAAPGGEPDLE